MVPSTLRSGREPGGSAPLRATSTVTVPLTMDCSMRETWPSIRPLEPPPARRVSMTASCPGATSLIWVSAIFSSAFRWLGWATLPRGVPAATFWPSSIRQQRRRHRLQHPFETGPDLELIRLLLLELVFALKLIDLDLLSFQLGLFGRIVDLEALFIDFEFGAELLGLNLGNPGIGVGQKVFLGQGGIAVGLQLGGIVIGAGLGGGGAQIEEGLVECDLEILVIGLGCLQGKLGIEQGRLEFRAGEDHHH